MSSQLSASLFRLKLLDALRADDESKVKTLFSDLSEVEATVDTTELIKLKETILHYAVQVAPLSLIQALVANPVYGVDINAQDADGNTPLHLAVAANRFNVVKYLMSLPLINDTVVNAEGKQPVELTKDSNVAQLMQFERAKFVEKAATELRQYFSKRDFDNLENLLVNNPRAAELLDINGADPETGNTVLHEFIRKEDLQMCEWILKHGGDPFKRDKKGKLPLDLVAHRSDPIRKLLKSVSKDQNMLDPAGNSNSGLGSAPTYKGYLKKWTNFASGYKLRYFILDQFGILSYYTNQGDTINACRGSLNLGYAFLHLDSSEKLKFEIIGKNGIKWHLKANHPMETNRWVWTLQNAITAAKDRIKRSNSQSNVSRKSLDVSKASRRDDTSALEEEKGEKEKRSRLLSVPGRRRLHRKSASQVSVSSFTNSDAEDNHSIASIDTSPIHNKVKNLSKINETGANAANSRVSFDLIPGGEDFDFDLDESIMSDSDSVGETKDDDITQENIQAICRSVLFEIESLRDLFKVLGSSKLDENEVQETERIGSETFNNVKAMIEKYLRLAQARDARLLKQIERQKEVNKLWENSIRQLEDEMQKQQHTLAQYDDNKVKLRKLLESRGFSSSLGVKENYNINSAEVPNTPEEESKPVDNSSILEEIFHDSDEEFFDADDFDDATDVPQQAPVVAAISNDKEQPEIAEPKIEETMTESQVLMQKTLVDQESFLGYENPPRSRLAMDSDDRPKVGLWGILKSMIGKDMTKMTLPVSFNECTSLLQRLAEDIEYNDLLSRAAAIDDSTLRMVYVTAFAASEYASTIDRIAKPFNPLLGETFEYCRKDQDFRLVSEQVSHHPPISACCAQSVKWDYYGENAVDSQFRGRSFDFKHLGKMFCAIRPDKGALSKDGSRVEEELYSWKKVNTSVVGIMLGNPTVDNYGTMEVTNHTTGDIVRVDMKQRGWKASSAYQLSGVVSDAKGNNRWAIGGHWNSKIFAKKISGSGELDKKRRESLIDTVEDSSSDPYSGSKFLVWQAAPRPKVPFNLTQFAITLNEINDNLKPWLPPTDTRLRPDQRAMEDGRYDEASEEKHRVEEKQRAARKKREINREAYKPNWFIKLKHPVTNDSYWKFKGDYWEKRKNKQLAGCGDIF
ncbi:hypothetical protein PUMCH_002263 [Australozyma saopauloensis]|uniref:PH domain-containing protein n=1 Tax=Australozyma saopauloensis TaxID=291208 RepID=A0AAX4H907_9ASCO|nr:hypothetical protein PUMCH_002263 [[Candida] saopauloensis]